MADDAANADPPVPAKKRRRRWFQFSLRSLLIFVTLVALFCQFVIRRAVEQHRIVLQLEQMGARVGYDDPRTIYTTFVPPRPKSSWLDGVVGFDVMHRATGVAHGRYRDVGVTLRAAAPLPHLDTILLAGCDVTDSDLAEIRNLKTLKVLQLDLFGASFSYRIEEEDVLRSSHLTDCGLAHLENLAGLETLSLASRWDISDTGIRRLKNITALRSLNLEQTALTGAGLADLRCQDSLEELNLWFCQNVDDAAMKHVARFKSLQRLNLGCSKVTDAGLAELEGLESLQELDLQDCHVTDAGMKSVGKLKSLQTLCLLGCTNVTDQGLRDLEPLGEMDEINLNDCAITKAGVEEVAKKLHVRQWGLPQEWRDKIRLPMGQSIH